ncbi:hypothetical protein ACWT_3121 [Actinoplanes sp. SE50]|uniref:STAS domain-containing protein n=1 Tax=unclassified Actinoplanes TaxID=2626549 RepID=UPI00023EC462|nr:MULTISPECIES: STAS domain-containing protein [unclassified Actinoplanes]AEV84144.1 hypothetical protein ACPL_3249 [Actinoplanes sp. SE50/110]ATO82536.1 hypothetical protein ACWT_3121 [Actinoplanes sp. SE50]SLL99943.1 hypothetical protein ACSP50_3175 [Actinoplanes sp. SE50/110]
MNPTWQHSVQRDTATSTIALSGELDLAATATLNDLFAGQLAVDGIITVRVDLSAVTFLDSTVITTLIVARNTATAGNRQFTVTHAAGHVRRVLTVAGVLDTLTTDPG